MEAKLIPEISKSHIVKIVKEILPHKNLHQVIDHGVWVRHNFELVFKDKSKGFMKIQVHNDWLDSTINEMRLCEILTAHGIPAPGTIFADAQGTHLGMPFVIQSGLGGTRLSEWLSIIDQEAWPRLFEAVGETYSKIHSIIGPASGVWDCGPEKTLQISPNDFYFNTEIMDGSGKYAFDNGLISKSEYLKIQSIWEENLSALKDHRPSLVRGNPFPWTICLSKDEKTRFQVTRLNALGDFLWWDLAYDLAFLFYPPGYVWPEACKRALVTAYGPLPEDWRIILYAILQHLCAMNDVYLAPDDKPGPKISKREINFRLKKLLTFY